MRRFNTEGPVFPARHYCIPPLARLDDVDRVLGLVRDMRYFVLHAPRQTGKTSALLALRDLLNIGALQEALSRWAEESIEPLLRGDDEGEFTASNLEHARDIEYVRDLGLIAWPDPVRMANPIYAEVVPRELSYATQARLMQEATWYVRADGDLDVDKLMGAFQTFFREHSEHWLGRFDYQEAGPQLLLQGFLQRIVNGGGRIEREYGLGYGRTGLLIVWPFATTGGAGGGETAVTKTVVECKVLHRRHGLETTIAHGLQQTARYMDRCGSPVGHLVIFDPSADKSWDDKVYRREENHGARSIVVWGM